MYTQNQIRVHFYNSFKRIVSSRKVSSSKIFFLLYLQIFDLSSFWELSKCLFHFYHTNKVSGRQFISFPATWCHSCWRLIGQSSLYSLLIGQGPGLAVRHLRGHSADQHHGHGNPGRWDEEWLMWPCILWLWPDLTWPYPLSLPPLPLRYCDVILRDVTGNEQWITLTSTPTVQSGCGLDDGKERCSS